MKSNLIEKYGNIRVLGFVLFVLASIFCLYKIYDLQGKPSDAYKRPIHTTTLKLINVIGRHGDRAPSDGFPSSDKHGNRVDFFWPNGYSNLTDIGRMRQFRIGLELRRRYRDFLSFNSSHYLAFSSAFTRCHESLNHTLRGLFQLQWSIDMGRKFADAYRAEKNACGNTGALQSNSSLATATNKTSACQNRADKGHLYLPSGSGSPSEYRNISIDMSTVPTLDWRYLESCKYFTENPPAIYKDLMTSKSIASLKGITKLAELLKKNYRLEFDTSASNLWSTVNEEIRLARTGASAIYGEHYYNWINELVPGYKPESGVTYFDLWAQVVLYYYRDRLADARLHRMELGPIVTSLVQSQRRALGLINETVPRTWPEPKLAGDKPAFNSLDLYENKKAIFYSTHDGTLQALMHFLNITHTDNGDFETRFNKLHRLDDVEKNLGGLKMVEFGASLVFELYESELREHEAGVWRTTKRFAYLQAAFYNEEDVIFKPVAYKRLKLGSMCKEKFRKIYKNTPNIKHTLKEQFYDSDFQLDELSCPFELFKNITSDYLINQLELSTMCNSK
uniref:2-phosphoxylose phosphatase 1 n=1 Tax=Aceria tosichella TaxID=561515 RepID=A0A6G1S7T1_9ACAR